MRFGAVPGVGGHPLFVPLFFLAVAVDIFLFGTLTGPVTIESAFVAGAHGAFISWMFITDRAMRKQRAIELERLRQMRDAT